MLLRLFRGMAVVYNEKTRKVQTLFRKSLGILATPQQRTPMHPIATKKVKLRNPHSITTRQAVRAAGSAVKLAQALGITKGAVSQWGTHPPLRHQERIIELYQEQP